MGSPVLTIDLGHPPRHPDDVEAELDDLLRKAPASCRVLKIVHGYGSSGKGGSTRSVVRNWAYRRRARFRAVIPGESFTVASEDAQALVRAVGPSSEYGLISQNEGVTYVWMR